jgi:hypothetical protein
VRSNARHLRASVASEPPERLRATRYGEVSP